jgi:hypothetical protein
VLVAADGELIAGHGRVLAAAHLGLSDAPVIVMGHLTEAQRRAYRIADNKLTELGGWDEAGRWDKVCVCADEVVGVRGCCVLTRACRIAARHHRAGGGQQRAQVGVLRAAGRCAWRRG